MRVERLRHDCDLLPWPHDVIHQGGSRAREGEGKMGSGYLEKV